MDFVYDDIIDLYLDPVAFPILNNIKLLLGIVDDSKDALIALYMSKATVFVKKYCNVTELNHDLKSVIEDLVLLKFRNRGIENLKSGAEGAVSYTLADLPLDIISILKNNRKINIL